MAGGGKTRKDAFWDASGPIQANGSGTGAPNVDNSGGVRPTPETTRYSGERWLNRMGRDKRIGRLGEDKELTGCTRCKI